MRSLGLWQGGLPGPTQQEFYARESRWNVILDRLQDGITVRDILAELPSGELSIHDFTIEYEAYRRQQGVKEQTIVRETAYIRRALKMAKRMGLSDGLPDDWPTIRSDDADESLSGRLWAPEQIKELLRALQQDARDEVELALLTGLRFAELNRVRASTVAPAPCG